MALIRNAWTAASTQEAPLSMKPKSTKVAAPDMPCAELTERTAKITGSTSLGKTKMASS